MNDLAPVILFVYNRPSHTRRTLQALEQNILADQSELYIFSDAPKAAKDIDQVNAVRAIIREPWKFKHIHIIERAHNRGLANSVIEGVSKVVSKHGRVIVFEDDLLSSPYALQYFNDALNEYENDLHVMHISGYMYPVEDAERLPETFLFRVPSSWGWATWQRAWQHFSSDIHELTKGFRRRDRYEFSVERSENFWKQVKEFKSGKINSWAIRWYLSVYKQNGMSLYPRHSHIQNIGTDGSGTHSDADTMYRVELAQRSTKRFTVEKRENPIAFQSIKNFYKHRKGPWMERLARYVLKRWHKIRR